MAVLPVVPLRDATRVTVLFPVVVYVCVGFWLVAVVPSPKLQDQAVGLLVDESKKLTVDPTTGSPGLNINELTGAADGAAAITIDWVKVFPPLALEVVRDTVRVAAVENI